LLLQEGEGIMELQKETKKDDVVSVSAFIIPESYMTDNEKRAKKETAA
jgi:hypothetical protein